MPNYIEPKRAWWISDEKKWKYFRDNGTQIPIDLVHPLYLVNPDGTYVHKHLPTEKPYQTTPDIPSHAIKKHNIHLSSTCLQ